MSSMHMFDTRTTSLVTKRYCVYCDLFALVSLLGNETSAQIARTTLPVAADSKEVTKATGDKSSDQFHAKLPALATVLGLLRIDSQR